jgi:plasmid stabilization system protein ParE
MIRDDAEIKPAYTTPECDLMLKEAAAYIEESSPKQAEIMLEKFRKIKNMLEVFPEIGTRYKNGMRKIQLGKFRYFVYYKVEEEKVKIVGIQHTSRGTEFSEEARYAPVPN